jgi:hypothetical protein
MCLVYYFELSYFPPNKLKRYLLPFDLNINIPANKA